MRVGASLRIVPRSLSTNARAARSASRLLMRGSASIARWHGIGTSVAPLVVDLDPGVVAGQVRAPRLRADAGLVAAVGRDQQIALVVAVVVDDVGDLLVGAVGGRRATRWQEARVVGEPMPEHEH